MSLVTVERFFDTRIAELARMKLESEGIPVHLHSMGHASILGAFPLGGVRIQVPESRAEEAREILKQLLAELNADDDT